MIVLDDDDDDDDHENKEEKVEKPKQLIPSTKVVYGDGCKDALGRVFFAVFATLLQAAIDGTPGRKGVSMVTLSDIEGVLELIKK